MFSFLGAFFMSLPNPIIGGILCVTFSMIVAIGISNLQNVDLTSTRNIFIVGFSVFFGLVKYKYGNYKFISILCLYTFVSIQYYAHCRLCPNGWRMGAINA